MRKVLARVPLEFVDFSPDRLSARHVPGGPELLQLVGSCGLALASVCGSATIVQYFARDGHPSLIILFGCVTCAILLLMSVRSVPESIAAHRHSVNLLARGGEVRISVRKGTAKPVEFVARCVDAELQSIFVSEEVRRIRLTLATQDGPVRVSIGRWTQNAPEGATAVQLATILQVEVSIRHGSRLVGKVTPCAQKRDADQ